MSHPDTSPPPPPPLLSTISQEHQGNNDREHLQHQVSSLQAEVGDATQRDAERVDGVLRYAQEGDLAVLHELQKVRAKVQDVDERQEARGRRISESRSRMESEMESMRNVQASKERQMKAETQRMESELRTMKQSMLALTETQGTTLLHERDEVECELNNMKAHLLRMVDNQRIERERAERSANAVLEQAEAIAYSGKAQQAAETEAKLHQLESDLQHRHQREAETLQSSYTQMLGSLESHIKTLNEQLLHSQQVYTTQYGIFKHTPQPSQKQSKKKK